MRRLTLNFLAILTLIGFCTLNGCTFNEHQYGFNLAKPPNPADLATISTTFDAMAIIGAPNITAKHDCEYWYYFHNHAQKPLTSLPAIYQNKVLTFKFCPNRRAKYQLQTTEELKPLLYDNNETNISGDQRNLIFDLFGGMSNYNATNMLNN